MLRRFLAELSKRIIYEVSVFLILLLFWLFLLSSCFFSHTKSTYHRGNGKYFSRSNSLIVIFDNFIFNESTISIIDTLRSFHVPAVTACQWDAHHHRSPFSYLHDMSFDFVHMHCCDDWDCYTLFFLYYFHFISLYFSKLTIEREKERRERREKMNDRTNE
jgi:hypothetical protein